MNKTHVSRWSNLRYRIRRNRLNRFYNRCVMEFYKDKGRLLDIGCGDGNFMSYMKTLGWDVFGVEVDRSIVDETSEELKKRIIFINSNLDEANFKEDAFDVITLWNVFEHISDTDGLLNIIKKILKKGGLLALQVPNIQSLEARIFRKNWVHLDPPRHVHHFSASVLFAILSKKFKIESIKHFSPIDKSYRGSFENLARSKIKMEIGSCFFHNLLYKILLDLLFIPLTIFAGAIKKGTFLTIACINEK